MVRWLRAFKKNRSALELDCFWGYFFSNVAPLTTRLLRPTGFIFYQQTCETFY